ncbi:ABC transporter substrate-binding protein [Bradyrhizobium prioriisuperbiae]|uniref:ABC transporter substrate-binding protein n=1 Tax=Bradyrhizobium prioriisuperbiae TaxID=2854389 RepID=UPI0028E3C42A|nr:ABC transporter substrate-binding protein [Bradyrhizobium prioritasuperba]
MSYTPTRRRMLLSAIGAGVLVSSRKARAATALRFSFERPLDGTTAPFMVAAAGGLFGAEGVTVTMDTAAGSQDAISRVASGASEMALADLNALIRFRDGDTAPAVKAVFVLFDKAPYAVIARRSRGINTLTDVEGKTLGVAEGDLAIRFWPSLAHSNNVNSAKVRFEKISAAVREPILSAGQVDAVTGFSYLSAINLRDRGIPASDLAVLRFADYGCEAYGQAVIVNPKFAADHVDAVSAFLRALIAGVRLANDAPGRAIDDVITRVDGASRDLELERLRVVLKDNIVTDHVKAHGLGSIDAARFRASLQAIAADFKFHKNFTLPDIFDDTMLPPPEQRQIN